MGDRFESLVLILTARVKDLLFGRLESLVVSLTLEATILGVVNGFGLFRDTFSYP